MAVACHGRCIGPLDGPLWKSCLPLAALGCSGFLVVGERMRCARAHGAVRWSGCRCVVPGQADLARRGNPCGRMPSRLGPTPFSRSPCGILSVLAQGQADFVETPTMIPRTGHLFRPIVESLPQGGWWFTGESRGILVSGAPGAASPSGVLRTRTPTTITWKTSSEN